MTVVFLLPNETRSITVEQPVTVAEACRAAGFPPVLHCGGTGVCGRCRVLVTDGAGERSVLACQTPATDGMQIHLTAAGEGDAQILTGGGVCPGAVSEGLLRRYEAVAPLAGAIYGAACDLGTTTVVLFLYELRTSVLLGRYAALNRQSDCGTDVISRLQAGLSAQGGAHLQQRAVDTINGLLGEACAQWGIPADAIRGVTLAGNSAMHHLLLGLSPARLVRAPYVCVTTGAVTRTGAELGLAIHPRALVECLPLIGGFVGGDTVAAMLAADMERSEQVRLLIDLGTNGELVLGDRHKMLAASAAAGPAMEGAGVRCGMRGTHGAIEGARLDSSGALALRVIGGGEARGICGSGLVDLIAVLRGAGLVTARGRLADRESCLAGGGSPALARRLEEADGERRFRVAGDVCLYQGDIRAFQLSKGAIGAAIALLMQELGGEVREILLAGAFGNYIDLQAAQSIGLIPTLDSVPVRSLGNGAGTGAQLYLLSEEKRAAVPALLARTRHMEFAESPAFRGLFARHMALEPWGGGTGATRMRSPV